MNHAEVSPAVAGVDLAALRDLLERRRRLPASTYRLQLNKGFTFRDATAGDLTYPAGRFLKTPLPQDGQLTIDFNKAYNPPCAFTPYATCPLPPPQNHLPQRIEAGEMYHPNL